MSDMSKPQGLFKRGNVWWYQRRIPRDLIHKFRGQTVLKQSLGTQDYAEAKILRNRVAVKFEAQFKAAKAASKAQSPITKDRSKAEILSLVRDYVRREDAERDENYWRTDWSAHPNMRLGNLKRVADLIELYKNPSDDFTYKAIVSAGYDILRPTDILELEENWDYLQRAVLELEKRELARMNGDYQHATHDHLFEEPREHTAPPVAKPQSMTIKQLVDQYAAEYAKTKATVGDKRRIKVSAAMELIVRFFGSDTRITDINPISCSEFRDILNELPSNLRKHFPDTATLPEIVAKRNTVKLPIMAWDTQEHYLGVLKKLFRFARDKWLIDNDPTLNLIPLGTKPDPTSARNPFTKEQLITIFNAPLYRGRQDDEEGYTVPAGNVIRGTRFWIPLIAFYTGMRLNEICQLDIADVQRAGLGNLHRTLSGVSA